MALHAPTGRAAMRIRSIENAVTIESHGPGAEWMTPHLPALLGLDYVPPVFSEPPKIRRLLHQFAGFRIPRMPTISIRLVQVIIQQLISFDDASRGWKELVRRYGEPVEGDEDLWYPPEPATLARLSRYDFTECGLLPGLGERTIGLCKLSRHIEAKWRAGVAPDSLSATTRFLSDQRGIGPWSVGYLSGAGLGDADAEVLGDFSNPKFVSWFFKGTEVSNDEQMLQLLEPFRPHRFYVLSMIMKGRQKPQRRGPQMKSLRDRFR